MSLGLQAARNALGGVMLHAGTELTSPAANLARENPWAVTFGQPRADVEFRARPYSNVNKTTWVMPEAYKGRSEFIENTMLLLARANNSFVTSTLLPMVTADGALMTNWNKWMFPTQMPDVIAPRGTPRLVKSSQIEGFDVMTMYGIGMTMEHGFMKSDLGLEHYRMHMRQINQSVSEGLQFQGIYKLLTCEDWAKKYMLVNGAPGRIDQMERVMKRELSRWAILQTHRNAWSLLNDLIDAENDIINPNTRLTTYLIDNSIKSLIKHSYDQTNVSLRGAKAAQNIDDTLEGFRLTDNGDAVFVTRGYLTNESNEGVIAPMKRHTQIGECHATKPYDKLKVDYSSRAMAVTIYDQGRDDWANITLEDMLQNCNRFHPTTGKLYGFNDPAAMRFSRENFSPEDEAHDFLHYRGPDGNLVPVEYFGHIDRHHMNVDDYINAGDIASAALAKRLGRKTSEFIRITQAALGVINIVRNYEFAQDYLDAVVDATGNTARLTTQAGEVVYDQVGRILASGQDSFGSLEIPNNIGGRYVVPPLHVFSYGGLKAIQQVAAETGAREYNPEMMKTIAEFVTVIDDIVPVLQRFFPNSMFLNPEYALPHHRNPTAHDTFVESLVLSGTPFTPLYYNPGTGDATDAGVTNTQRLGNYIESQILGGVDRAVESVIGTTGGDVTAGLANIGYQLGADEAEASQSREPRVGQLPATTDAEEAIRARARRFTSQLNVPLAKVEALASGNLAGLEQVVRGVTARKVILTLFSVTTPQWEQYDQLMNAMYEALNAPGGLGGGDAPAGVIDITTVFQDAASISSFAAAIMDKFNSVAGLRRRELKTNRAFQRRVTDSINEIGAKTAAIRAFLQSQRGTDTESFDKPGKFERYLNVATGARNNLVLTPLGVSHKFIDSYVDNLSANTAVTWLPASFSDPREVMDLQNFKDRKKVFESIAARSGTSVRLNSQIDREAASMMVRSGVESIHAPARYSASIQEGIEHNSVLRTVVNRQRMTGDNFEASQRAANSRLASGDAALRAEDHAITGGAPIGAGMMSNPATFQNPYLRSHQESLSGKRARDAEVGTDRPLGGGWAGDRSALADTSLWSGSSLLEEEERAMQRARLATDARQQVQGSRIDRFLNNRITSNFATLYTQITKASDLDLSRWLSMVFLGTPVTNEALKATIKFDLLHPFRYVLARPHARNETVTALKMLPGLQTGRTRFGHVMAEVGDDPIQRIHTVNLTYWSSALITNPKNININHNVAVVGYSGGLGSGFYQRGTYNPQQNKYGISANDSIFVFAIPLRERIEASPFNITGRFDWISEDGRQMGDAKSDLHYSTAAFYNGYWGFQQYRWNSDLTQAGPGPLQTHFSVPNAYCYPSMTKYEDETSTSNLGHWKNHTVGPGCAGPRVGQGSFLNAPTVGEASRSSQIATVF